MKILTTSLAAILVVALMATSAVAQRPGGDRDRQRPGGDRGRQGPGGDRDRQGPPRGGSPISPIMVALDANHDGEISAREIDQAVSALRKLDRNHDGKLTREELRPQFGDRGGPGRGGPGGRGDARGPGRGGPGGPGRGGPGGGGRGGPGGAGDFLARLLAADTNDDGKISKDELPEGMERIMGFADTNGDGELDKSELDRIRQRARSGGGPRGGPRGGGDRPQRPQRPDA